MDAETIDHPEVNKDQNAVSTADPDGPKYLEVDSSFLPEVPKDHDVLDVRYRYERKPQKTSETVIRKLI